MIASSTSGQEVRIVNFLFYRKDKILHANGEVHKISHLQAAQLGEMNRTCLSLSSVFDKGMTAVIIS